MRGNASTGAFATAKWDTFLEVDGIMPEHVFRRIDTELEKGRRMWVAGELFATLALHVGHIQNGKRWLVFPPRRMKEIEWLNRVRDAFLSATALFVLSPLLSLIAILVKLSSPGPVFYAATVIGRDERPFTWFKFRSMRFVAPQEDERRRKKQYRVFADGKHKGKTIDDSRVTPVGRIIRKYSLDELPQLWNVLRGQMSLVGPRPCLPYEAELFPPWAKRRFDVRPGLTGVWQVYGRSRVGFEEALAMDVYYQYVRSFWMDVELLIRTVGVVLKAEGAR